MKTTFTLLLVPIILGTALIPVAFAEDAGMDDSIVNYVASNEGEPMRVDGTVASEPVAEPPATLPDADGDSWEFVITPYLWTIAINGDFKVRGRDVEVDMDFGDVVSVLDMALCLRGEAWHGPLGFTVDFTHLSMKEDVGDSLPVLGGDLSLDMTLIEVAATYLFEWRLCPQPEDTRVWTMEPILGLRYVAMDVDLGIDLGPVSLPSQGGKKDWVEPFVGFRSRMQISEDWTMSSGLTVGGFGIGSRVTLVTWAGFDYRFSELLSGQIGYKWMYIDYAEGSGNNRFVVDATLQGFWIGLAFHF